MDVWNVLDIIEQYIKMPHFQSVAHEGNVTDSSTSYTITRLEEDSSYTITLNAAGNAVSDLVTGMTGETGEGLV